MIIDSLTAEKYLLGALMLDNKQLEKAFEAIKLEMFSSAANRYIYTLMHSLYAYNKPFDCMTLIENLKENGVLKQIGGENYIFDLAKEVPDSLNITKWINIIKTVYINNESLPDGNFEKVVRLLNKGWTQKDISMAIGIDKSNVSRHATRAKEEGFCNTSRNTEDAARKYLLEAAKKIKYDHTNEFLNGCQCFFCKDYLKECLHYLDMHYLDPEHPISIKLNLSEPIPR